MTSVVAPVERFDNSDSGQAQVEAGQPPVVIVGAAVAVNGKEEEEAFEPNEWELFLAGEECGFCCNSCIRTCGPTCCPGCQPITCKIPICSCCSCWTFFGVGWFFFLIFLLKIMAEGDKIFSEETGTLKADLDVKNYYGFTAAQRSMRSGCGAKAMQDKDRCEADDTCEWIEGRGADSPTECKTKELCPAPEMRPRESFLSWFMVVYEAQTDVDENILDDEVLEQMSQFEKTMLTTANGANMPWTDWCMRTYLSGDKSVLEPWKCAPPSTPINLFGMTPDARAATREQVQQGYTRSPFSCMCTDDDQLCSMCTAQGTLKGWDSNSATWNLNQFPNGHCLVSTLTGGRRLEETDNMTNLTLPPDFLRRLQGPPPSCGGNRAPMSLDEMGSYLNVICSSKPSCQWDGPDLSFACSSKGFFHPTDRSGDLLKGAEKQKAVNAMCDPENKNYVNFRRTVFASDFDCSAKKGKWAKSMFMIGGSDPDSEESEKNALKDDYISAQGGWYQKEQLMEREIEKEGKLRIMLFAEPLIRTQFLQLLAQDGGLSAAALVLVWLYMWYTLESLFLASCAIFEILFSLPVGMSLWTVILGQKIEFLQMLVIYMILGIGADDAFIANDAWMQSRFEAPHITRDWRTRFAWAYRRSFSAMAVTTSTTVGSFMIGVTIPLPSVRDFCIFAAVVVFVDWLFCITFFNAAMVVNERFFAGAACWKACGKELNPPGKCLGPGMCWGCCRMMCTANGSCWKVLEQPGDPSEPPKPRAMERFCAGPLHGFLAGVGGKVVMGIWIILVITGLSICGAMLRTAEKSPPIGRESIDMTRSIEILMNEFPNFRQPKSYAFWGLDDSEPVEYGDKHADDEPKFKGGVPELSTPAGQLELLSLCRAADKGDDGKRTRCESDECVVQGDAQGEQCQRNDQVWKQSGYYVPADALCQPGRYCFMEEFARFWAYTSDGCYTKNTSNTCTSASANCRWDASDNLCYTTRTEHDYPGLPSSEFISKLGGDGFKIYMERRSQLLNGINKEYEVTLYEETTGFQMTSDGSQILFAFVGWNATYALQNTVEKANEWYDRWQEFHDAYTPTIGGVQTMELYTFRAAQNEMVKGAILGIVSSLCIAFVILTLATMNWWIAGLGLLNICAEVSVFLGLLPLIDWSLGEYECIFMIATVGLSVDYTVHLLHAYNHSEATDRVARGKAALSEMGISVVNSAITTLLAAFILFFCGFYFFFQFGVFIFLVILVSIFMSLTFLMPLMMIIGPEGEQGRLLRCCTSASGDSTGFKNP